MLIDLTMSDTYVCCVSDMCLDHVLYIIVVYLYNTVSYILGQSVYAGAPRLDVELSADSHSASPCLPFPKK